MSPSSVEITDPPRPPRVNFSPFLCADEQTDVKLFLIDREPGVNYTWDIPASVLSVTRFSANGDTVCIADISAWNFILDFITITAENSCDAVFERLFIELGAPLTLQELPLDTICTGRTLRVSPDNQNRIQRWDWDFNGGEVVNGDETSGEPFDLRYETEGLHTYTLFASDGNGCVFSQDYQVMVYDAPPQPAIQCTSMPNMVILDWIEDPNFTYDINTSQFESNLTGVMTGPTQMTVTGFNSPCQFAIFSVIATGTNPEPCNVSNETSLCRPSPRPEFQFQHQPNRTTYCEGDAIEIINLVAVVNGTPNPPTGVWEPTGSQTQLDPGFSVSVDGTSGTWDPTGLAIDEYDIQYTYTNPIDGCTTMEAVFFRVMERPLPNAQVDQTDICADEEVILTFSRYEDQPAPNVTVPTGMSLETLTDSTRLITFPNVSTTHEIIVAYDNIEDCEPVIESVFVTTTAKPTVDLMCGQDETNAINIEWNNSGFGADVVLNGQPIPGSTTDNSMRIDGLAADTGYEVIVNLQTLACGVVSDTIVCRTTSCVPAMVDLSNVPTTPICYDPFAGVPIVLDVNIQPGPGGAPGSFIWDTPLVDALNNFTPDDPLVRDYILPAIYEDVNGCTEQIDVPVSVLTQPRPFLNVDQTNVCLQDGQVSIMSNNIIGTVIIDFDDPLPAGVTLVSGTGNGPFEFAFSAAGEFVLGAVASLEGCSGPREEITIIVEETPILGATCADQGEDAITLEWNDLGLPVSILQDGSPIATDITDQTLEITNLAPNTTFEFIVSVTDPTCGLITETISCVTFACIDPDVTNNIPQGPICWDIPSMGGFPLDVVVEPGAGGAPGNFVWDSPDVNTNGEFTPQDDVQVNYSIDGIYTDDDGCTETITVDFTLVQTAVVSLSLMGSDTLCGDGAEVTLLGEFNGIDPNEVVFVTDFPPGVTADEVAPGEFRLTFPGPGDYPLSMRVDYFGCEGETQTEMVHVMAMPELNLDCGSVENTSVTLIWDDIQSNDYQILRDGILESSSSTAGAIIDNLPMGETFEFTVETLIPECGVVTDRVICRTFVCPPVNADLTGVPDVVCHDSRLGPILLDVLVESVDPADNGRFEWDTPLVDENNMFTPEPGVTSYDLDILYTDDNDCDEIITLSFGYQESPRAEVVNLSSDIVCVGESVEIMSNYVSQGGTVSYITDFPAEAQFTGADGGPYTVTFTEEGVFQLGIAVEEDGCLGTPEFVEVTVEPNLGAPMVTCESTFGGLILDWQPMNCASSYIIFIDGEQNQIVTGTSAAVLGLEGEQEFEWSVEPISNCRCDGEVATGRCTTDACPVPTITVFPVDTCFGADVAPFALNVDVQTTGDITGGEGSFTGPLIDINRLVDISFADDPGIFEMSYTFIEGGCETVVPVEVELTAPPQLTVEPSNIQCGDNVSGTVIVSVQGGTPDFGFSINGGEVQPDNIFEDVPVGSFFVEVSDDNGCLVSVLDEIESSDLNPEVEIEGLDVVVEGSDEEFFLEFQDVDPDMITNISWTFNGTNICEGVLCDPILLENVVDTGLLEVVVELDGFCELRADKLLDINFVNDVFIPNVVDLSGLALPPDNEWTAFVKGAETFITSVQVFDRWGNKVRDFENNSLEYFNEFLIWDGFFGSEPAEQGVYTYVIELLIEGEPEIKFGSVTIFR